MSRTFAVNAPAVVSEVIDGEAVIMNLQSGHYFSTREVGALLWGWLAAGVTEHDAVAALAGRYGLVADDVRLTVADFVSSLELHALLTAAPAGPAAGAVASLAAAPARWSPPALGVHTDMEDLLLLDPIHDVGASGWPAPKPPEEQVA